MLQNWISLYNLPLSSHSKNQIDSLQMWTFLPWGMFDRERSFSLCLVSWRSIRSVHILLEYFESSFSKNEEGEGIAWKIWLEEVRNEWNFQNIIIPKDWEAGRLTNGWIAKWEEETEDIKIWWISEGYRGWKLESIAWPLVLSMM